MAVRLRSSSTPTSTTMALSSLSLGSSGQSRELRCSGSFGRETCADREAGFGDYILGRTLGEGEFGKVKLSWRKPEPGHVPGQRVQVNACSRQTWAEICSLQT